MVSYQCFVCDILILSRVAALTQISDTDRLSLRGGGRGRAEQRESRAEGGRCAAAADV